MKEEHAAFRSPALVEESKAGPYRKPYRAETKRQDEKRGKCQASPPPASDGLFAGAAVVAKGTVRATVEFVRARKVALSVTASAINDASSPTDARHR